MFDSRLEPATEYEVLYWLEENLNLTESQIRDLRYNETIKFSEYKFYKRRKKEKVNFLWRLTLPFFVIYYVSMVVLMPFKYIFTGTWYYSEKFLDNFHLKWVNKISK